MEAAGSVWISRLACSHFRSYESLDLDLPDGPLAFVGTNGAGKTNLLEAVSLFAPGRGLRGAPAADVAINMGKWNALPDDVKAIVEIATKEFARDMVQSIIMDDIAAADAAMSQGVTLVNWTAEERTRFREVAMIEWEAFANKSPLARKLVDSQVAFLRKLHLVD